MPRARRKRVIVESDSESEDCNLATRRSSLRVNLSFTSNLSDAEESNSDRKSSKIIAAESDETAKEPNEALLRTVKKRNTKKMISDDTATPASIANVTVIDAADRKAYKRKSSRSPRHTMSAVREKEQQLDKSCMELRNAIISKTQSLLDNELTKKTSEILTGCSSPVRRDNENDEDRSPSVRINIGNNDQIFMVGCGEKQNPVQISSMSKNIPSEKNENNKASQDSDHSGSDCSQSIASTPKKFNTAVDKSTDKTSKHIIKIPVARLFANSDLDNSMSEMNLVPTTANLQSDISKENERNKSSNFPNISSDLHNAVSPILSQGTRKTRISRLSLKRNLTTDENKCSRVSVNNTNESFINRTPLTCSSFIERTEKTCNDSHLDQHTKTIILEGISESSENKDTINLDDNENNTNTINIDNTCTSSSMEITTISARTPIIRKSFQQIIRESFIFDTADIPVIKTKKSIVPTNKCTNESSASKSNSASTKSNTSLSVDTSLDDISLAERTIQNENRRPNNAKQLMEKRPKSNTARESQTLTTMRSSLHVNTSLDSVCKSSDSSTKDSEQKNTENEQLQIINSDDNINNHNNQEKQVNTEIRSNRLNNGTVRSSMQMNTSLDSVQKSPRAQEPLDYNKIVLSMVQETSSTADSECFSGQQQLPDDDSNMENVSLQERIRINNDLKNKKMAEKQNISKKMSLETSKSKSKFDSKRKSSDFKLSYTKKSQVSEKKELKRTRKSNEIENNNLQKGNSKNSKSIPRRSARKSTSNSIDNKNVSSTTSESSIIEATPFPASRSLLFKTIIKNNIAMNTLNARQLGDSSFDDDNDETHLPLTKKTNSSNKHNNSCEEKSILSDGSDDTVIVNSSDESSNESNKQKERIIIDESLNETGNKSKPKINKIASRKQIESRISESSDEDGSKKINNKRKLYPLRENSQVSFSPAEIVEAPLESAPKDVKKKKRRKMTRKKQENVETVSPAEPAETCDPTINEISIQKQEKKRKKPRKIKSKKIVIKKVTNLTLLDNMLQNEEVPSKSDRSSLQEFDLKKLRDSARKDKESNSGNHKIVIVVTGHEKDDRDLVKNVVKSLGCATVQANVTPRTTHVISSGVRTINLLKGIIRGCWLLTLEWALKSLESGKWLDPSPYEMSHFAKAVQVNRRDRKLMGKGYVPELFITCGPIYIENGTVPPASNLKELVKTAGGRVTEDLNAAKIIIGLEGLKESWILDSITTGEIQPFDQYKRN